MIMLFVFPKDEYYVLSGASLVLREIKEEANDLDLCVSEELFDQIKDKFNLTDEKKNDCGFYKINDKLEIVVDKKDIDNIKKYLYTKNTSLSNQ